MSAAIQPALSERQFAYFRWRAHDGFSSQGGLGLMWTVAARPSKRAVAHYHHRYPSPNRSALTHGRPVSFFRLFEKRKKADIGYHGAFAIELFVNCSMSGAIKHRKLGKYQCKNLHSFSPLWPFWALLAALKVIWSAALPVLVQVWLSLKRLAPIRQVRRWLALLLAFCVTMQAFAVRHADLFAFSKAFNHCSRRRGITPAAVLRSGERE